MYKYTENAQLALKQVHRHESLPIHSTISNLNEGTQMRLKVNDLLS